MSETSQLIARFVENRDGLSETELDALITELRTQPHLGVVLRSQLTVDDLLSQKLALDRRNFLAQVGQRIGDFEQGEEEVFNQVAEMRAMAEAELQQVARPAAPRKGWYALLALAGALLLASALLPRFFAGLGSVAELAQVSGDALVLGRSGSTVAAAGVKLSAGDEISVRSGSALLKYADGTQVNLSAGATAVCVAGLSGQAKQIRLDRGELTASVTPQTAGAMEFLTPHARAIVRGTELRLVVVDSRTQLEVSEGKVELAHHRGGQPLLVAASQTGVADEDRLALRQLEWPEDREAALFVYRSADEIGLARNPETGNLRHTPLHPHGRAFASSRQTLILAGGGFASSEAGEDLAAWIRREPRVALEVAFVAERPTVQGAQTICAWGQLGGENLLVQQEGDQLVLLANAAQTGAQPLRLPLGKVQADASTHLLVSCGENRLVAFVNGASVGEAVVNSDKLGEWSNGPLRLGSAAGGDSNSAWRGVICGLAVYQRTYDATAASHSFRRYQELYAERDRGHHWTNLLADVDLSQFKGEGGWQLEDGAWVNSRTDGAWLSLASEKSPRYELLVDLAPQQAAPARLVLPVGDGWCAIRLGGEGGSARLETLAGEPLPGASAASAAWTAGGHRLEVAVQSTGEAAAIACGFDGQSLLSWRGSAAELVAREIQPRVEAPYLELPSGAVRIEAIKVRKAE